MGWPHWCEKVMGRLARKPREVNPNYWKVCCPVHDDDHESATMALDPRTGCLLFVCHASQGCTYPKFLAALGIKSWDMMDPQQRPQRVDTSKYKFAASYDYKDISGVLRYQVVRWVDPETQRKTFSQRRPNPDYNSSQPDSKENPRWLYNMDGVQLLLYRLPELRAALNAKPDRIIFIVEGEKAVDAVRDYGLVATTHVGGAGKWLNDYNRYFAGRNVVIVPDQDNADEKTGRYVGQDHGQDVALSLYGVARSVQLLNLNQIHPGSGLDDWLAHNGGKSAVNVLRQHVDDCEIYQPPPEMMPISCYELAAQLHRMSKQHGGATGNAGRFGLLTALYNEFAVDMGALVQMSEFGQMPDQAATAMLNEHCLRLAALFMLQRAHNGNTT